MIDVVDSNPIRAQHQCCQAMAKTIVVHDLFSKNLIRITNILCFLVRLDFVLSIHGKKTAIWNMMERAGGNNGTLW